MDYIELIKKYDRPIPRYTSYPPVPNWNGKPTQLQWINSLACAHDIDLYLHIPFCKKLCYYCGCNRLVTKNQIKADEYIEAMINEWHLYQSQLPKNLRINSLHLGGGTPTFLNTRQLDYLLEIFKSNFSESFTGSIEIDPRTCTDEHIKVLANYNFKRVSLGIQDFDINVQKKINRIQPYEMVADIVKKLRNSGIQQINFDLIYGLPAQSIETISNTIKKVITLSPETIAFYSYAHLPSKIKNQKLICDDDLPPPTDKLNLYLTGKNLLKQASYKDIGMDHFANENSYLLKGEITRNFMGYTNKKSDYLIGLGVTAIGNSPKYFVQNAKELNEYYDLIIANKLPIMHGHKLNTDEIKIGAIIENIMCQGYLNTDIELTELESDGLIAKINDGRYQVTEIGKTFLRNIAAQIDPLFINKAKTHYSKSI